MITDHDYVDIDTGKLKEEESFNEHGEVDTGRDNEEGKLCNEITTFRTSVRKMRDDGLSRTIQVSSRETSGAMTEENIRSIDAISNSSPYCMYMCKPSMHVISNNSHFMYVYNLHLIVCVNALS